jgi:hypothetical protein
MPPSLPELPATGLPALDAYLTDGYDTVRGMSSRFAAVVCSHLLLRQSELGLTGHAAEIGTFEGRFFIALALALAPGERAVGIDLFDWPHDRVQELLHGHCARHGLAAERYTILQRDSRSLPVAELGEVLGGRPVRLFHVDGEHGHDALVRDLALAEAVTEPRGVIVLDDMLHPAYPTLADTVHGWLRERPEWRVLCIIDREDIVAAAKYVLCRVEAVPLYEEWLQQRFEKQVFLMGADFVDHWAVVLTPWPRLAEVD